MATDVDREAETRSPESGNDPEEARELEDEREPDDGGFARLSLPGTWTGE